MKVACAVMGTKDAERLSDGSRCVEWAERVIDLAGRKSASLIVLPGLLAAGAMSGERWLEEMRRLSSSYPSLWICPGSFLEQDGGDTFHASCLLRGGEIALRQRQIYLSRWERAMGLARGKETAMLQLSRGQSGEGEWRAGILLTTDVHYPEVARELALGGANLVLCPMALIGGEKPAALLRGVWQIVQQNLFYAVESGMKGMVFGQRFHSSSLVHAPLAAAPRGDGFLATEARKGMEDDGENIIVCDLDLRRLQDAMRAFNPLRQLNPDFYRNAQKVGVHVQTVD